MNMFNAFKKYTKRGMAALAALLAVVIFWNQVGLSAAISGTAESGIVGVDGVADEISTSDSTLEAQFPEVSVADDFTVPGGNEDQLILDTFASSETIESSDFSTPSASFTLDSESSSSPSSSSETESSEVESLPSASLPSSGAVTVDSVEDLVATIAAASGDLYISLSESFPTALPQVISLHGLDLPYDIVIDGIQEDGSSKTLVAAPGSRHFSIESQSNFSIQLRNITLDGGLVINEDTGYLEEGQLAQGGIELIDGQLYLYNVVLRANNNSAIRVIAGGNTYLSVYRSNFIANSGGFSGAIDASYLTKGLSIAYCYFNNNVNTNTSQGGGALFLQGESQVESYSVNNSVFLNNRSTARGGAISLKDFGGTFEIKSSYLLGNQVLDSAGEKADGGAFALENTASITTNLSISRTTFAYNQAYDDGGALFIESPNGQRTHQIINSTFYSNRAFGNFHSALAMDSAGGAIQLSDNTALAIDNSTFTLNAAYGDLLSARGGALGVQMSNPGRASEYTLHNNIIVGNSAVISQLVIPSSENNSAYDNIATLEADQIIDLGGNLGLDNGTNTLHTPEAVFGSATPRFWSNFTKDYAGNPLSSLNNTFYYVPTVSLLPEGIADQRSDVAYFTLDQRGYVRTTPGDLGATESAWIRYQANGGSWINLPVGSFDGRNYLPDADSDIYYEVNAPGNNLNILKSTNLQAPTGKQLKGWATAANGSGSFYLPGATITLNDNVTLFAVWEDITYTVEFDPMGATYEYQDKVIYNSLLTAPAIIPVYPGYLFLGWYKDMEGKERWNFSQDRVKADMTLYALWQLNQTPTPTETVTPTPTAKPTVSPTPTLTPTVTPEPTPVPTDRPTPTPTFKIEPGQLEVSVGDTITYTLQGISNPYADEVEEFAISFIPADGLTFLSGQIPAFTKGSNIKYEIRYSTTSKKNQTLKKDIKANEAFSLRAPDLGTGEQLTEIVLYFPKVPKGFAYQNKVNLTFKVGQPKSGSTFRNKAAIDFSIEDIKINHQNTLNSLVSITK